MEPDMSNENLRELIDAWSFNVMLECSGREESKMLVAMGGAFLDLRDLDKILTWAMGQARPAERASDDEGPCTDCDDTGITIQTERRCSCDAAEPAGEEPVADRNLEILIADLRPYADRSIGSLRIDMSDVKSILALYDRPATPTNPERLVEALERIAEGRTSQQLPHDAHMSQGIARRALGGRSVLEHDPIVWGEEAELASNREFPRVRREMGGDFTVPLYRAAPAQDGEKGE
ncbi:hypothetical protein WBP07_17805 [Novosphingobium sp. BL-8A]|uniref:hypothetical protein n=1 Tax=Novosphingobium sp. BL-8A TaxID=3127639 RepID=UPI0037582597